VRSEEKVEWEVGKEARWKERWRRVKCAEVKSGWEESGKGVEESWSKEEK
jgi:hypothetical protein